MAAKLVTSSCRASILSPTSAEPAACSSFARRPRSRMLATTRNPRFASSTQVSNPKPLEDPVTMATRLSGFDGGMARFYRRGRRARRSQQLSPSCLRLAQATCPLGRPRLQMPVQYENITGCLVRPILIRKSPFMAKRQQSSLTSKSSKGGSAIQPAKGKLGIMIPGMGAVATTFVAGVEAVRKGLAKPIGSLTQMGTIRLGKRTDNNSPALQDFVPLAGLKDLVFTGWDIFEDDMYTAASKAGVLERELLQQIKPFLSSIKPRQAVFDRNYVRKLDGRNVKKGKNKMELAEQVRDDIREFKKTSGVDRLVTIWCGSTEIFLQPTAVHADLKSFEKGLAKNDENIAPSMIYAYASLMEGVPFANGAPNLTVDLPVMLQLSRDN